MPHVLIRQADGNFRFARVDGDSYTISRTDYTLPKCLYSQLYEILNDQGVILQFLNRYDNFTNRLMVLNAKIRQLIK